MVDTWCGIVRVMGTKKPATGMAAGFLGKNQMQNLFNT